MTTQYLSSTKRCFKCGRRKPLRFFYEHPKMSDGRLGKCTSCAKRDVRENRLAKIEHYREYERERFKNPERRAYVFALAKEYRRKYPGKTRCRNKISIALRDGKLERQPCLTCGSWKSEAHHPDYRRPLFVEWLCIKHHGRAAAHRSGISR